VFRATFYGTQMVANISFSFFAEQLSKNSFLSRFFSFFGRSIEAQQKRKLKEKLSPFFVSRSFFDISHILRTFPIFFLYDNTMCVCIFYKSLFCDVCYICIIIFMHVCGETGIFPILY